MVEGPNEKRAKVALRALLKKKLDIKMLRQRLQFNLRIFFIMA